MDYQAVDIQGTEPNTYCQLDSGRRTATDLHFPAQIYTVLKLLLSNYSTSKYFLGSRGMMRAERAVCPFPLGAGHLPCRR